MTRGGWWLRLLPLLGLGLALWIVFRLAPMDQIYGALLGSDPGWLAAGAGCALLATAFSATRLFFVLIAGNERVVWSRCWRAVWASVALNVFLPARGGDLVKAIFLTEKRERFAPLTALIVIERLLDLGMLGLIALSCAMWQGRHELAVPAAGVVGLALGIFTAGLVAPGILQRVRALGRVASALRAVRRRPDAVACAALAALVQWLNVNLLLLTLLWATRMEVGVIEALSVTPLAILVGLLPLSISGIGTRDVALAAMLCPPHSEPAAIAAGVLFTAIAYWFLGAIGFLVLGTSALARARRTASQAAEERQRARSN